MLRAELETIPCEVVKGTQRDAFIFALGANAKHGLKRSNADKRKAVELALADEELGKLSVRKLSAVCGVSISFISNMKAEVSTVDTPEPLTTTTQPTQPKQKAKPATKANTDETQIDQIANRVHQIA